MPATTSLFEDSDDHNLRVWQRYASPVWFDIDQTRVLNYQLAKDNSDEKHICPLQLDVIERSIQLWTNPGDVVFSPFTGIGSEGYCAIKQGRKFIGIELKESYWKVAARNLAEAELQAGQTDLFAAAGVEVEGVA
jgi:DNA modification methylase